jgi:transposase-like protein
VKTKARLRKANTLYAAGYNFREIGERVGIAPSTARRWIKQDAESLIDELASAIAEPPADYIRQSPCDKTPCDVCDRKSTFFSRLLRSVGLLG